MSFVKSLDIQELLHDKTASYDFLKGQLTPLTPDASARRYYRLVTQTGAYVLSQQEPFCLEDNDFLNIQSFLSRSGLPMPSVVAAFPEEGIIVQQDLGDQSLESLLLPKFNWSNQDLEGIDSYQLSKEKATLYYKKAIDLICHLQQLESVNQPPREPLQEGQGAFTQKTSIIFNRKFDQEKYNFEWQWSKTHLFEGLLELKNDPYLVGQYDKDVNELSLILEKHSTRVTHRDFHSRNLMIVNDKMFMIDFQDARLGPATYDLVSLLRDCYLPFDPILEEEMKKYYFDQINQVNQANQISPISQVNQVNQSSQIKQPHSYETNKISSHNNLSLSWDEFLYLYELQALQRSIKAAGSFASFKTLKNDKRYLKYILGAFRRTHIDPSIVLLPPGLKLFFDHAEQVWTEKIKQAELV